MPSVRDKGRPPVAYIPRRPMPVSTEAVGKTYPPVVYAVGREKVREYAAATGETNPVHLDPAGARVGGLRRRGRPTDVRRRLLGPRHGPGDPRRRGRDEL